MKKPLLIRQLVVMAVFLASVGARAQVFKDENFYLQRYGATAS